MKKFFSKSLQILISALFGLIAAFFADSIIHYHFAFAGAYLFSAIAAFYFVDKKFNKIFGL